MKINLDVCPEIYFTEQTEILWISHNGTRKPQLRTVIQAKYRVKEN
jgi:hypothetical protein